MVVVSIRIKYTAIRTKIFQIRVPAGKKIKRSLYWGTGRTGIIEADAFIRPRSTPNSTNMRRLSLRAGQRASY